MSQQNKTTLQSAINTQLADNTSGDISAADVRDNLINMTDSLLFNSGSQGITGSLTANSFTGSLQGTATTASYIGPLTQNVQITGSLDQTGSLTLGYKNSNYSNIDISKDINNHHNIIIASGVEGQYANTMINLLQNPTSEQSYISIVSPGYVDIYGEKYINFRSNQAGGASVRITGSLDVNGSITGSLQGTASYATTASYVLPTLPSSILVAADGIGTNFTSVVSTTFKTYLIPANTLTTSSVLEVNVGIVKDTGTGAANIYLALSSSIATTTIAYASINTSQTYGPLWRNFAISGSSLISFTPNSSAATDAVTSTLAIVSSSIDTTIDNYIQVNAITLGSSAVARISYCKIIAHR